MNCGMECIKYLIFIFNFIFALGGLAILVVGVLIQYSASNIVSAFQENNFVNIHLSLPASVLIAVGAIIFIIAFFGCCGAARESHCMIVTFAVLLLTLLVIQIAVATYLFIQMKDENFEKSFNEKMHTLFNNYFDEGPDQKAIQSGVNTIQSLASCCGYSKYTDYTNNPKNPTPDQFPYACCGKTEGQYCKVNEVSEKPGCKGEVVELLHKYMNTCGGLALGIAAIELIGIIFSFCLANSIRNVERRGYKV